MNLKHKNEKKIQDHLEIKCEKFKIAYDTIMKNLQKNLCIDNSEISLIELTYDQETKEITENTIIIPKESIQDEKKLKKYYTHSEEIEKNIKKLIKLFN